MELYTGELLLPGALEILIDSTCMTWQTWEVPKFWFTVTTRWKTNMSPENQWLVQMYFLLKCRPFLWDIR